MSRIHISLPVRDLEHAIDFYERLLGQPVTKRRAGYANFRLTDPPIHLALEERADGISGHRAGHSHFGIELPDAGSFVTWRDRLRDAGAQGRDDQDAVCCYAKADKVWLTDPDGNAWEIWVRKAEVETMHAGDGACCAAA